MGRISDSLSDVDYEQHEDTLQVELAGTELPWFIGRVTFDLVRQHDDDVDFAKLLTEAADAAEGAAPDEQIDTIGRVIWAGMLPFEPDLDYDVVARAISFQDLPRLAAFVKETFDELNDETLTDEVPTDADRLEQSPAGKAPSA